MDRLVDRRRDHTAEAEPGDFLKVLIPVHRGDFDGSCEGIWVRVLQGNAEDGVGVVDNDLEQCDWARCGDRVAYKEIRAGQVAYVLRLADG